MSSAPPPPPSEPPTEPPTGPSARDRIRAAKPDPQLQRGEPPAPPATASSISSSSLIIYGIFGGIGILFTIGWIIVATSFGIGQVVDPVAAFMGGLGNVLAVMAPFFWGLATFVVTRNDSSIAPRMLWLLAGVVVLAPYPYLLGWN